jgi:hypothetical protein
MKAKTLFSLNFAPEVVEHMMWIERKFHSQIRQTLKEQLTHNPDFETRNRKVLIQPAPYGATWELRFGPQNAFRALYEIVAERFEVWILAVGIKEGRRLKIGGKEY